MPSDADLMETLRLGMPGSSMPPWGHLGAGDLRALVLAVRRLAVDGRTALLLADAAQTGPPMTPEEARGIARDVLSPGAPVVLPPRPPTTAKTLEEGRAAFLETCAPCHDADGRGRLRLDLKDGDGNPTFARDFTRGVFKGGSDEARIALRVFRGLPGSPMPASDMEAGKLWAVAAYAHSLAPAGDPPNLDRSRRVLAARKVAGPLGTDPADPAWESVDPVSLPVAPLWWRNDRIETVEFRAARDGERLAIRLRWEDSTADDLLLSQTAFGDGAALQFSNEADPPFFGMGSADSAVNIWHWKAAWRRDAAEGAPGLAAAFPAVPPEDAATRGGMPEGEEFATARAAGNPVSRTIHASPVEDLDAGGFGTLTSRGPGDRPVLGGARRVGNAWEVAFLRPLGPATDHDVALEPGTRVALSLAVWDGAAGDRDGQKSVTIWHELEIGK